MSAASRRDAAELERLRDLVEDQHRRLRLVQGELAAAPQAAAWRVDAFPARCAKPRLARATLARLLDEAALRLALEETSLGAAIRATWPEPRPDVPVLRPTPGLAAYGLRGVPDLPNLVIALFGLEPDERARAIARVLTEQRGPEPFLPVFLTNDSDLAPFRDQRLAFEYFPLVLDEAAPRPDRAWAAYFLATLVLTLRRWGVRRVIGP